MADWLSALITGGATLGSTLAAGAISKGQQKANRRMADEHFDESLYEDTRRYDQQWQYAVDNDLNKPWHKLGNASRDIYFDDTQRTLDMERKHQNQGLIDQYNLAKSAGATLQEFLGSPAAGGIGNGGASAIMGNQMGTQSKIAAETVNSDLQRRFLASENAKDRDLQLRLKAMDVASQSAGQSVQLGSAIGKTIGDVYSTTRGQDIQKALGERGQDTQLAATGLSAAAQVQAAGISAAASRYLADTQKAIADQNFGLEQARFRETVVPAAAAALRISEAELMVKMNEVATTDPEFVKARVQAVMSAENVLADVISSRYGLDVFDDEAMQRLSRDELTAIVTEIVALQSIAMRETSGGAVMLGNSLENVWDYFTKE